MHLTAIQPRDIIELEALFAKRTASGWMVPVWVNDLLSAKGLPVRFPGFYIGIRL